MQLPHIIGRECVRKHSMYHFRQLSASSNFEFWLNSSGRSWLSICSLCYCPFGRKKWRFSEACCSIKIHISTDSFANTTCVCVCNSILLSLSCFQGPPGPSGEAGPPGPPGKRVSVMPSKHPKIDHFINAWVCCFDIKSLTQYYSVKSLSLQQCCKHYCVYLLAL